MKQRTLELARVWPYLSALQANMITQLSSVDCSEQYVCISYFDFRKRPRLVMMVLVTELRLLDGHGFYLGPRMSQPNI